jgi:hypothetical protein
LRKGELFFSVWVLMSFDERKVGCGADVLSSLIIFKEMGADGFGLSERLARRICLAA